ncbi:Uncharacterised protein [uncultured Streptococcus sp.]|nr:Uncharacterised protein [uncultured Streptococcus sp.]
MAAFSAFAASAKLALAASFTVSKLPGVCTPSMAVTPAVFAASTASAVSAAVILASSAAFVVSTSFSFAVRWADVKLLSAAMAAFSAFAASAKLALALDFAASRSNAGLGALGIITASLISDDTSLTVKVLP